MLITLPIFFIFIAAFRQWGNEMMVRLILALEDNTTSGLQMFQSFNFFWVHNVWMPDNGLSPDIDTAKEFFGAANAKLPQLLYFTENPDALQKFVDLGFFVKDSAGAYTMATMTDQLAATYKHWLHLSGSLQRPEQRLFHLPYSRGRNDVSFNVDQAASAAAGARTGSTTNYAVAHAGDVDRVLLQYKRTSPFTGRSATSSRWAPPC